jgi:hypothetical protein
MFLKILCISFMFYIQFLPPLAYTQYVCTKRLLDVLLLPPVLRIHDSGYHDRLLVVFPGTLDLEQRYDSPL